MKVLAIMGSPKEDGNSSTLAKSFLSKASSLGAETKSYFLENMKYKGCNACGACKTKLKKCIIQDDLTEVLDEMYKADIIIYSSPNYFYDVSGQFKLFFDRQYSLLTPQFKTGPQRCRLAAGKKAVFIFTQAAPENCFENIPTKYSEMNEIFGFSEFHFVRGCNLLTSGAIKDRPELIQQVETLASQLVTAK